MAAGVARSPAGAAERTTDRAADRAAADKAREHFQRGEAFFKLEKYREALSEYERGYLAKSDASFLYNIAQCHRLMGNKQPALRFYRRFLSEATRIPNREMVEQHIHDLEKALGTTSSPAGPAASTSGAVGLVNPSSAPAATSPPPVASDATPGSPATTTTTSPAATAVDLSAPAPAPTSTSTGIVGDPSVGSPAPDASSQPIYRKWWFWTAIGVVVVGGSVAAYVALHKGPTCEAGRSCM